MIAIDTWLFIVLIILAICFGYLTGALCRASGMNDYISKLEEGIFFRDAEIKELKARDR